MIGLLYLILLRILSNRNNRKLQIKHSKWCFYYFIKIPVKICTQTKSKNTLNNEIVHVRVTIGTMTAIGMNNIVTSSKNST